MHMLSKEFRLRRDKDFQTLFKSKKGVFDSVCGIKFKPNGLSISRFAVVVGVKVSKSAVKRNKIRRHYQEILRHHKEEILTGFDIVLLTSKPALDLEYAKKEIRLLQVLKKGKLLK